MINDYSKILRSSVKASMKNAAGNSWHVNRMSVDQGFSGAERGSSAEMRPLVVTFSYLTWFLSIT